MLGWIKPRIPIKALLAIMLMAVIGYVLVNSLKISVKNTYYERQVASAEVMAHATELLKELRLLKGIPISRELDPNQTGLIGIDFTELTTTSGQLDAKATTTNHDFAALMVQFLHEAGVKEGDFIGVGASGSFPALLLATLSAMKVMELKPIIIYSIGSSMYGANIPGFTFIDMLEHLNEQGFFNFSLAAVSMGGIDDRARGTFQDNTELIMRTMKDSGVSIIYEENLVDSIQKRKDIYATESQGVGISCFVNIGGACANYGANLISLKLSPGLILELPFPCDDPVRGLIFEYAEMGIPVIHLLNAKGLATMNGIPIAPVPLPLIGQSGVYYRTTYRKPLIISLLLALIGAFCWFKIQQFQE